jgi:hypothetical protein
MIDARQFLPGGLLINGMEILRACRVELLAESATIELE